MRDDEVVSRLQALLTGAEVAGPVARETVDQAAADLGVVLPRSYRLFLEQHGACKLNHVEVAGIDAARLDESETPYWNDFLLATRILRRASRGRIPSNLVCVSDDGGDYKFYLDTSVRDADGECPVIVLGPGMDGDTIASSFLGFLARAARGDDLFTGAPWK